MLSLLRCLTQLRNKIRSVWSTSPKTPSPLLELNVDVVILIISFLPQCDRLSAALTCKSLLSIYNDFLHESIASISRNDKEDFLLRLERDLMATHHYCAICMKLHRFSSLNKPNEIPFIFSFPNLQDCLSPSCFLLPPSASNYFAYHHGRAAMNRHFYGPPAGLNPDSLHYKTSQWTVDDTWKPIEWSTRYSVRMVCDSLFLFARHTMDSTSVASLITMLDQGTYSICPHTTTSGSEITLRCHTRVAGLNASEVDRFLREPGRVVQGSCSECLTDYTVAITRNYKLLGIGKYYRIQINTYHDFGQFRSPQEWKWRAWQRKIGGEGAEPRDVQVYPPGTVRQRYYAVQNE